METGYCCPHCRHPCFAPRPGQRVACPNCRCPLPEPRAPRRAPQGLKWLGALATVAAVALVAMAGARSPRPRAPAAGPYTPMPEQPPDKPIAMARRGAWTLFADRLATMPDRRVFVHGWIQYRGGPVARLPYLRLHPRDASGRPLDVTGNGYWASSYGCEFRAEILDARAPLAVEVSFIAPWQRADFTLPDIVPGMPSTLVRSPNRRIDAVLRTARTANVPVTPDGRVTVDLEVMQRAGPALPALWLVAADGSPIPFWLVGASEPEHPAGFARYRYLWKPSGPPATLKLLSVQSAEEQAVRLSLRELRPSPPPPRRRLRLRAAASESPSAARRGELARHAEAPDGH